MASGMLAHYNASAARAHFTLLVREAVREGRPVVIAPRDEAAAVVVSRAQLLELLASFAPHLEIIPEGEEGDGDGTGGFTIWVEELRATSHGATLAAALDAIAAEAAGYVRHFLAEWPRLKHTDRAKDFPYVARLALAETPEEFRALLLSGLPAPLGAG